MVQLVVLLLVAGILLLLVEAVMPGFGVFGSLGIAALAVAAVIMAVFIPGGVYFAIIEILLVSAGIILFFKLASKRGLFKKLVMEESLNEDASGTVDLTSYEGKTGVTKTPLRPVGMVDFGGVPVEAYSTGEFIELGEWVVVAALQDNKIFVKPADEGARIERSAQPNRN